MNLPGYKPFQLKSEDNKEKGSAQKIRDFYHRGNFLVSLTVYDTIWLTKDGEQSQIIFELDKKRSETISKIQVGNELIIALTTHKRVFQYDVHKKKARKIFPLEEHENQITEIVKNGKYNLSVNQILAY